MGVNEDIRDAIILRGHDLARFETGQARDLVKILDQAHDSILTKIAKTNGEWTRGWLKTMLGDIKSTYGDAFGAMGSKLDDSLKQLAGVETAWSAKTLDDSIPLKVSISQPAPAQVWAAITTSPADRGHVLSELMASYQRTTVDKITGAIRQGVVEGETSAQMVSRIRGTRAGGFKNGVMQTSRNAAQALVSTAVMHVSNTARQQTYKENADILNGWQWVATLDTLTCPECAAEDGKVHQMDEQAMEPPAHINCRCTTVPVVKSWKDLGFDMEEVPAGTRASMDGQVASSLDYENWLKGQPASVQVDALGPARAKLFQNGTPIGRFMKDGRSIPLSVLDPNRQIGDGSGKYMQNSDSATGIEHKLWSYSLNPDHPDKKYIGFKKVLGFTADDAEELGKRIREALPDGKVATIRDTPYGKNWAYDLEIAGKNGNTSTVRTVWTILKNEDTPRMVSAWVMSRRAK